METVDNIHYLTQDQWRDKYKLLQRENSNLLVLLKNEQLLVEEKIMVIKLKDIEIDQVRQANKRLIRSYAELRTRLENILKYDLIGKPGV